MAAPIVYRWDDANAPVCRGERRSLHDILYACLVTGYGSKPGLGWTREFVNVTFDKAAFRPGAGTRFFLQVDGASATNAYTPRVQGYESMVDLDNGLFPFNAAVQQMQTSNAANTTARPWMLIGDDRFFHLIIWNSITAAPTLSDVTSSSLSFGDFVPFNPNDTFNCMLLGAQYGFTSTTSAANYAGGGTYDPRIPRKSSGASGSSYVASLTHDGGPCLPGAIGTNGPTYVPGGEFLYTRPFLNDGVATSVRGWIPGIYAPCHPHPFSQQLQSIQLNGKNFIGLKCNCSQGTPSSVLICIDDWRG